MNARLLLSVLFLGAFALAFYLIFSLWPHEEPEPEYAPDLQHEAMVAVAEVHEWIAAHATTSTTSTTTSTTTTPKARTAPTRPARTVRSVDTWSALANCESGGNPRAVSKSGRYRGAFQFDLDSYRRAGGSGDPINDSYAVQLRVAQNWQRLVGWGAWPTCAARLGYL